MRKLILLATAAALSCTLFGCGDASAKTASASQPVREYILDYQCDIQPLTIFYNELEGGTWWCEELGMGFRFDRFGNGTGVRSNKETFPFEYVVPSYDALSEGIGARLVLTDQYSNELLLAFIYSEGDEFLSFPKDADLTEFYYFDRK